MRVLVLYAHPDPESYRRGACTTPWSRACAQAGHEVDDCDLYAEGFDPVLSREERIGYHDLANNTRPVAGYVERLQAAEALVLCFPVWNFGYPGDPEGLLRPRLPARRLVQAGRRQGQAQSLEHPQARGGHDLWRLALARLADGRPATQAGLPGRCARSAIPPARPRYLAHYDMNRATPESRAAFLRKFTAEKMLVCKIGC